MSQMTVKTCRMNLVVFDCVFMSASSLRARWFSCGFAWFIRLSLPGPNIFHSFFLPLLSSICSLDCFALSSGWRAWCRSVSSQGCPSYRIVRCTSLRCVDNNHSFIVPMPSHLQSTPTKHLRYSMMKYNIYNIQLSYIYRLYMYIICIDLVSRHRTG